MSKINILDESVVLLIAAGEVVERPASVIKELVENSIDAGAKSITVEIQNGGISFMRVTDDGNGIEPMDMPLAFISHATSKIKDKDDLTHIDSLGFRGEALPSIAAVSRVEVISRTKDADMGYRCEASKEGVTTPEEAGSPIGTTVVVRDLFYNVPARMKFLKKDVSEGNAVASVVEKIALSHPEIRIRFIRNGEVRLASPGNGDLISAAGAVYGKSFSDSLIYVDYIPEDAHYLNVSGVITKPSGARSGRNAQHFFVNGRLVKSSMLVAALEEAYKGSIMVDKHPGCILNITIPADMVDVNVHPAKTEVKFQNDNDIFSLIYYAVKSTLGKEDNSALSSAQKRVEQNEDNHDTKIKMSAEQFRKAFLLQKESFIDSKPYFSAGQLNLGVLRNNDSLTGYEKKENSVHSVSNYIKTKELSDDSIIITSEDNERAEKIVEAMPVINDDKKDVITGQSIALRYIGELFDTYALFEGNDEIVFLDKHAAHERILYEKLKDENYSFDSQFLLSPEIISVSEEEKEVALENIKVIERLGFSVEDFGKGSIIVRGTPLWCDSNDIEVVVIEILHSLYLCKEDITPDKLDSLFHSMACRGAIKAGDASSSEELVALSERILAQDIRYCPHGRPVSVSLSKGRIEKLFGRI